MPNEACLGHDLRERVDLDVVALGVEERWRADLDAVPVETEGLAHLLESPAARLLELLLIAELEDPALSRRCLERREEYELFGQLDEPGPYDGVVPKEMALALGLLARVRLRVPKGCEGVGGAPLPLGRVGRIVLGPRRAGHVAEADPDRVVDGLLAWRLGAQDVGRHFGALTEREDGKGAAVLVHDVEVFQQALANEAERHVVDR